MAATPDYIDTTDRCTAKVIGSVCTACCTGRVYLNVPARSARYPVTHIRIDGSVKAEGFQETDRDRETLGCRVNDTNRQYYPQEDCRWCFPNPFNDRVSLP